MGMVLRFPIERARIAPAEFFADEEAKVLILPTVRIERGKGEAEQAAPAIGDLSPSEPNSVGGRRRRRTPRS
jgi:hypothetical protein